MILDLEAMEFNESPNILESDDASKISKLHPRPVDPKDPNSMG